MRFLLLGILLLAPAVWAQKMEPDEEGCRDSTLVTRMPGCRIYECSVKDYDSAEMTIGRKADEMETKSLEGKAEVLTYECAENVSLIQIVRNLEAALKKAGYQIVFSGRAVNASPMVTGRKAGQWVQVETSDNGGIYYTQKALAVEELNQQVDANADAWAAEIEKAGRVSVYGIQFDTGKSSIRSESEPVLAEVAGLLKAHGDWRLRIEGHTDNTGSATTNQTLSKQRALAVISWLTQNGVSGTRLSAEGYGSSKPVAGNDTDEGRAKNRRVDLVKL